MPDEPTETVEPATGATPVPEPEKDWKAEAERLRSLARKHEDRAKENYEWRKANEDKIKQFAALEEASKTEAERAIETARREARDATRAEVEAEARAKYGSVLVGAEFRVALAGRLSAEQIGTLVDGLDVTRFMTDDGQPDTDRIGAYVAAIPTSAAPVVPAAGPQVTASQGIRPPVKASGLGEGASLYADRHAKRAPSAT
jgi:hypothetical protein